MKLSLMTQRLIFPLGSPGYRERWHQHSCSCQGGTAGRQHYPSPGAFGSKKSFSLSISAKLQLDLHKAGVDGTQEKPHPGLGVLLVVFPPTCIFLPWSPASKEVTTSQMPLVATCSSTIQHQCMSVWATPNCTFSFHQLTSNVTALLHSLSRSSGFLLQSKTKDNLPFSQCLETRRWKAVL